VSLKPLLKGLARILASSVLLIVLGLVYFIVTAWIVTFGVETVLGTPPSADFVALAAALLSLGSLAGSSYTMGGFGGEGPGEDRWAASEVA
jgi:hypothetical protein